MILLVLLKAGEAAKYQMRNSSGFQMFRVDRGTRGGGVLLYVSQSIEAVLLDHFDDVAVKFIRK